MDKKLNAREFLHSLSRINDRINQFDKDIKRLKREFSIDIKSLCEDSLGIRSAFDSFYKDIMVSFGNKNGETKKNTKNGGEK